ncbi:Fe-S oxidoreductase [Hoeflea phototrophica DFL-43]|uniref:Glycolate oxidase iron-sulfur subunit n=1 Tax=Hoeflea phototrophica (strain DSM 17068 / NCIMB 14078 / DFL-43) TaxID=411684 RepID=A9D0A4_HOEPD|nr:glycolate oxidase subunit GlcF [Hoeflea phototrophica]EDQ34961.1 Fe-S oxidoreductase [Hoeflea phototrophica DFL-43]
MQTNFTAEQLKDSGVAESEKILRKCVHCGFCTATCPTYVTLGNELDSPRGRIYLIKDMLENDRPADKQVVTHIDRCLSCLACMTTCPSGVNYMHLVDHARAHIEKTYKRPLMNRITRGLLAMVLPYPGRFRASLYAARLGRPFAPLFKALPGMKPMAAMLELAPSFVPAQSDVAKPGAHPASGEKRGRVAILTGCAQPVLKPGINEATVRLLNRIGVEVVVPEGEGCCGALVHHMGREHDAMEAARRNVDAWTRQIDAGGLDAIIITASGCGTTIKDYGYMLREDPDYAGKAAHVSAIAKDITEYLAGIEMPEPVNGADLVVAYHSACSMQHGQKITVQPKALLKAAGFTVKDPPEGHLCCGSAGTYNIMQPEIARTLRDRKVKNIERTKPDLIATGNIGCMTQIAGGTDIPIIHTVELLDWVYGGEKPAGMPDAPAKVQKLEAAE